MKKLQDNKKLDSQQQVYAKCKEYEMSLCDALQNAEQALKVQQYLDRYFNHNEAIVNCPEELKKDVLCSIQERHELQVQLCNVIKRLKFQLSLMPRVTEWLTDNYKNVIETDLALNQIFAFQETADKYNELKGDCVCDT